MTEKPKAAQSVNEEDYKPQKKNRGIIFLIISSLAIVFIPFLVAISIVLIVILQPGFYTGILKNGRLITAFIEARNWQTDRAINDEIENSLNLTRFTAEFEKIRAHYEQVKDSFMKISREGDIESLKGDRAIAKNMDWKKVKGLFPSEDQFEKERALEIERIDKEIGRIEEYQDKNGDAIKAARKDMKKAQSDYEDSLSALEDKKKEADKIIEKHKNTLESSLYDDLEIIERPLTQIINSRLIEGAVKREIEKILKFFTDYDSQVERGNVFYERALDPGAFGRRVLNVRVPGIEVGLWVDEPGKGKKHILSNLLVEEINRIHNLRNKSLLSTMFGLSDSSLGEYFGGKYLSGLSLSLDGGVVRRPALLLKGAAAERVAFVMEALSWGRYMYIVAGALLLLYFAFLFFSAAERWRKLVALKRLFIYPSLVILTACALMLLVSQTVFNYYPDLIQNLTIRSYAKHMSFIAAWQIALPLIIVFGSAFVAGLVMRKFFVRRPHNQGEGVTA
jgi:hypothetical protein